MEKIAVIINSSSGTKHFRRKFAEIRKFFEAQTQVQPTYALARDGAEIAAEARRAIADGCTVLVAAGGDGTVRAVAEQIVAAKDVRLGIIPIGRYNHFARDVGVPLQPPAAVRALFEGDTVTIDAALVNNNIFLNNSSIGLYPRIVWHRERQQSTGRKRWLAFAWSVLLAFRTFRFMRVWLSTPELGRFAVDTPFIFVGNNEYDLETPDLGARPTLMDGQLSVYIIKKISRGGLLAMGAATLFGGLRRHRQFDSFNTEQLTVESKKKFFRISLDGELQAAAAPLHYKILPQALRVIVPKREKARLQ